MSLQTVIEVIDRAVDDREFCELLVKDPEHALESYDLTPEERQAVLTGSGEDVQALGLDRRASKWELYTRQLATFGGW